MGAQFRYLVCDNKQGERERTFSLVYDQRKINANVNEFDRSGKQQFFFRSTDLH